MRFQPALGSLARVYDTYPLTQYRHGEAHRDFSAIIGWKALSDSIHQFGEDHEFTKLIPDLSHKDPDDSFSSIPYEKGFTFLYTLEKLVGKERWDPFIPHVGRLCDPHLFNRSAS